MFSAEDGVTVEAVVEAGAPEETIVDRGLTLVLIPQGNEILHRLGYLHLGLER